MSLFTDKDPADSVDNEVNSGWYVFNAVCTAVDIGLFKSLVLFTFLSPTMVAVIPATVPVNVGLLSGAFVPIKAVMLVAKFALLPSATASSLRVSRAVGAPLTRFAMAVATYAVVA